MYLETSILGVGDFPYWLFLHEGHRQDVGYTLGVIPYLTKTLQVSHNVFYRRSGVALDIDLLVCGTNVADDFIVDLYVNRALVVKENTFSGQPDLAGIPVDVEKKWFVVASFLDHMHEHLDFLSVAVYGGAACYFIIWSFVRVVAHLIVIVALNRCDFRLRSSAALAYVCEGHVW